MVIHISSLVDHVIGNTSGINKDPWCGGVPWVRVLHPPPQAYRVVQFVVRSSRLDSVILTEFIVLDSCHGT